MMRNLVASWPRERLAYLSAGASLQCAGDGVNSRAIQGIYGRIVRAGREVSESHQSPGAARAHRGNLIRVLKPSLLAYMELIPFLLDSKTERWLDDFAPEVIYTWLGSPALHWFVRKVARARRVPTVVHIMDDWVSCKYAGNRLAMPSRLALTRSFGDEIARASECIAISDQMADEYSARFGRKFSVIANGVDLSRFKQPNHHTRSAERMLTLGHIGRISGGRGTQLEDVVASLDLLSAHGIESRLELVGLARHALPISLRDSQRVIVSRDDSDEALIQLGGRVAAFLQVESFDQEENYWFRHSLSAKLPVYLALGKPVIAYGPRALGSINYVAKNDCGIVVDSPGTDGLICAVKRVMTDPVACDRWSARARGLAAERHDLRSVQEHFGAILSRTVQLSSVQT